MQAQNQWRRIPRSWTLQERPSRQGYLKIHKLGIKAACSLIFRPSVISRVQSTEEGRRIVLFRQPRDQRSSSTPLMTKTKPGEWDQASTYSTILKTWLGLWESVNSTRSSSNSRTSQVKGAAPRKGQIRSQQETTISHLTRHSRSTTSWGSTQTDSTSRRTQHKSWRKSTNSWTTRAATILSWSPRNSPEQLLLEPQSSRPLSMSATASLTLIPPSTTPRGSKTDLSRLSLNIASTWLIYRAESPSSQLTERGWTNWWSCTWERPI